MNIPKIYSHCSDLLAHVRDNSYSRHSSIILGIQQSHPKNLISQRTSNIYANSDAHIEIINSTQEALSKKVISNQIDIVLLNFPHLIKDKNLVKSKCILNTPAVLVGSEKFNRLKGKSLKEFSKVLLTLPSTSLEIRHKLELEFTRYRLDLNIIGEIDDTIIKKICPSQEMELFL